MATSAYNFRNALNGFNRADVVQFIQSQTMEHERVLRSLRDENTRLQEALEAVRTELELCRTLNSELSTQLEEAKVVPETEDAVEELPEPEPETIEETPACETSAPAAPAPVNFDEMELAAYRRAEMTERMARERAAASAERMKVIFSQANEKLGDTARNITAVMDAFRSDFERMQQLLTVAQDIVGESSDGLKAAESLAVEL